MTDSNVYAACDKAIRAMNRWNVEAFGRLKLADWDEVNVIRTVTAVYRSSARKAKKRYYGIGMDAYLLMMEMIGEAPETARKMAEKAITAEWVESILEDVDPITMYRFDKETERKAYRLAEALEVAPDRNAEIDKALKYWSRQLGQYALNATDYAMIQAMQDAGIEDAEWVTQRDEKVCGECDERDGQVYRLDSLPIKHPNCRCYIRPMIRV